MTERDQMRLERILRDLALPQGQWVLNGSGVMTLHGMDRHKSMGDVDIFVATRVWFDLHRGRVGPGGWGLWTTEPDDPKRRCDPPYLYQVMYGIEVNVFQSWRHRGVGDFDPAFLIHNAEPVRGWPCVRLQLLLDWKREVGREKDVRDILLLEEALGDAAA